MLCVLAVYYQRAALAKCSHLWPAAVSFRRKSEVMLSSGLFSLLTERLMLHSSQCTMTTYNVLFEVSDLHGYKNKAVFIKAFRLFIWFFCSRIIQTIRIKVNCWVSTYGVLSTQICIFFCFSLIYGPFLSPARSSQSRSALKWSINSIRTPTPPWRSSTHVSTFSAPRSSPKSPSAVPSLHSYGSSLQEGRRNSPRTRAIAIFSQTNAWHKFCSQRVFSYKRMPVVNFTRGGCKHSTWQMYTNLLILLEACVHFVRVNLHIKEW